MPDGHRLLSSLAAGLLALPLVSFSADAQIAVSANDGKAVLVDGVNTVPANPPPDTIAVIDLGVSPPKLIAEIKGPASVIGPPSSVAVSADESFALVTAATRIDPADPKKTVDDNRVSVVDLKASPPAIVSTAEAGTSAAGVAINRDGTLAIVANRGEGSVSVFTIADRKLTPAGKIQLGDAKSGPSAVAFTPDGKTVFVTRDGDHKISMLSVDGPKVEYTKRDLNAGLRPYPLDISTRGDVAVLANIGIGQGDADTVSLIDLQAKPPRVVDTITVGQTPEGLKMSPDGRYVAVAVMNGSNKPKASPFFNDNGLVVVLAVDGKKLARVTEGPVGHWCQGVAWSADGKTILVQCMVENEIQVFGFDGRELKAGAPITLTASPAGIGTASR